MSFETLDLGNSTSTVTNLGVSSTVDYHMTGEYWYTPCYPNYTPTIYYYPFPVHCSCCRCAPVVKAPKGPWPIDRNGRKLVGYWQCPTCGAIVKDGNDHRCRK